MASSSHVRPRPRDQDRPARGAQRHQHGDRPAAARRVRGLRLRRGRQGGGAHRRHRRVLRGRQPAGPSPPPRQRAARADPPGAVEAGDRGDRGLVRGRRDGAGRVVRPARRRRGCPVRVPRTAVGRSPRRRGHLSPAPHRGPRSGTRPHPDRARAGRGRGCADGLRRPGGTRRHRPRRRASSWPGTSPRRRGRASSATAGPSTTASGSVWPTRSRTRTAWGARSSWRATSAPVSSASPSIGANDVAAKADPPAGVLGGDPVN